MLIYINFHSFPGHLYSIRFSRENHLKGPPWQFTEKSIICDALFHLVRGMVPSEALTVDPFTNPVNGADLPTEHTKMSTQKPIPTASLTLLFHQMMSSQMSSFHSSNIFPNFKHYCFQ